MSVYHVSFYWAPWWAPIVLSKKYNESNSAIGGLSVMLGLLMVFRASSRKVMRNLVYVFLGEMISSPLNPNTEIFIKRPYT